MTNMILYEKQANGTAIITFNRPQALNALNMDAMRQFATQIDALRHDETLRVLILTGVGQQAFCSGGDVYELHQYPDADDARHFITLMGDALLMMERLPVPVIAAINGYALGGGSEIALACDLRIVDDQARMGFIQARLALIPGWGGGQRLLRLVGYAQALDILLHGHVMHVHEIQALGLAHKVVEQGTAFEHALHFAGHIAQHPPEVVRSIKALLRAGLEQDYETALQTERDLFPPLWVAEAHRQAVDDFIQRDKEKRNNR